MRFGKGPGTLVHAVLGKGLNRLLAARLSERHKCPAAMLVCPCLFAPGVQSYDYFALRSSRNQGAAIEWADQIGDIIAVVANTSEYRHGTSVAGSEECLP
jgi:hypothetical protein